MEPLADTARARPPRPATLLPRCSPTHSSSAETADTPDATTRPRPKTWGRGAKPPYTRPNLGSRSRSRNMRRRSWIWLVSWSTKLCFKRSVATSICLRRPTTFSR